MKEFETDCGKMSLKLWRKDANTLNIGGIDLNLLMVWNLKNYLEQFLEGEE